MSKQQQLVVCLVLGLSEFLNESSEEVIKGRVSKK